MISNYIIRGVVFMEDMIAGVKLEFVKGDITSQPDIDAIVNAANAQLRTGGGVAGAIHRAAGPELVKECKPLAPIRPGEAVLTRAYKLPNGHVIHCLGPVYGRDKPEDKLLANCYKNALKIAEENEIESIAFPALSTGAFGYPIKEATDVVLKTVLDILPGIENLKLIRFVLYSQKKLNVYREHFFKLKNNKIEG